MVEGYAELHGPAQGRPAFLRDVDRSSSSTGDNGHSQVPAASTRRTRSRHHRRNQPCVGTDAAGVPWNRTRVEKEGSQKCTILKSTSTTSSTAFPAMRDWKSTRPNPS